jgi:hypothetical protein
MSMIIDGTSGVTFPNSTVQASAGSVIQVVNQYYNTFGATSSTSYVDTGVTLSITPKFSTSKVLIIVGLALGTNNPSATVISTQLVRNGSSLVLQERGLLAQSNTDADIFYQYLDSPATTSATTYKVQYLSVTGNTVRINDYQNSAGSAFSSITLMEIAA